MRSLRISIWPMRLSAAWKKRNLSCADARERKLTAEAVELCRFTVPSCPQWRRLQARK
jgi:hypothetical protein